MAKKHFEKDGIYYGLDPNKVRETNTTLVIDGKDLDILINYLNERRKVLKKEREKKNRFVVCRLTENVELMVFDRSKKK